MKLLRHPAGHTVGGTFDEAGLQKMGSIHGTSASCKDLIAAIASPIQWHTDRCSSGTFFFSLNIHFYYLYEYVHAYLCIVDFINILLHFFDFDPSHKFSITLLFKSFRFCSILGCWFSGYRCPTHTMYLISVSSIQLTFSMRRGDGEIRASM